MKRSLWLALSYAGFVAIFCPSSQANVDPVFEVEHYEHPVLTQEPDGTTLIDAPQRPAGVYYRVGLDPTRTYRIQLHGERQGGPFILRQQRGERQFTYGPAPDGVETFRVSNSESFELLLFRHYESDGKGYRVRALRLEDCTDTCLTDADLKQEIRGDLPLLDNALATGQEYRAAVMLLDWASPRITGSSGGLEPIAARSRSAAELYYDFLQPGTGGTYCDGAAEFLKRLLDLFAIPSFQLYFGDVSWFTHATVAVPINTDDGVAYRLLDPTFRMHYTLRSNGGPVSVEQMLELWRAGMTNLIQAHPGDLGSRKIIVDSDAVAGTLDVMRCSDGSNFSTLCGFSSFSVLSTPLFASHHYTADLDGMLRLLGTTDLLDPDYTGVPEIFRQRHAAFKAAVENGNDDVRIADLPLVPAVGDPPTIVGRAQVGGTLSLDDGSWQNSQPIAYERRWQRCGADGAACHDIVGATGPKYVVADADFGHRLRAQVRATNEHGAGGPAITALSEVVPQPAPPAGAADLVAQRSLLAILSVRRLTGARRLRLTVRSTGSSPLNVLAIVRVRRHGRSRNHAVKRFAVPAGASRRVSIRPPGSIADSRAGATLVLRVWDDRGASQTLRRPLSTAKW